MCNNFIIKQPGDETPKAMVPGRSTEIKQDLFEKYKRTHGEVAFVHMYLSSAGQKWPPR